MNLQQAKALFFAQYLGQKVLIFANHIPHVYEVAGGHLDNFNTLETHLLLRSVSQLTDEEIAIIADMYGWGSEDITKDRREERLLQFKIDLPCICQPGYMHRHMKYVFDYLTRIGILLPFTYINEENKPVTLQPDEIIALGWAKYNTEGK